MGYNGGRGMYYHVTFCSCWLSAFPAVPGHGKLVEGLHLGLPKGLVVISQGSLISERLNRSK